ncbi:MAG: electron transport complex subunit RsxC [Planctomycetes bacterium]|nr:electron transport complex subunit RsxC [Planctomycetota bacterium]
MRSFRGGVHPPDMKHLSADAPIEVLAAPEQLVVPLSQHIGAPARPIVQAGDDVRVGQLIGEASGFVSAAVHSPVSGKVKAVTRTRHPLGNTVDALLIENDGQDRMAERVGEDNPNWRDVSPRDIVDTAMKAGIVGMGGATFPTHVKLSPPESKHIDTVILNAAECEPYLTCDYRLLLERTEDVIEGLKLLVRALTPPDAPPNRVSGIIAVEANKKDVFLKLQDMLQDKTNLLARLMPVKYPQGAEKQLIKTVLNREVPPQSQRGLPMDVGVVVQNVGTALALYEAVRFNKPLYERVLTVSGDAIDTPGNLLVRVGTSTEHVLKARGITDSASVVISGGPMMGIALSRLSTPVNKGTSGLLALSSSENWETMPCISCGACVRHCPMQLIPSKFSTLGDVGRYDETEHWNVIDCIECGVCTYVCPSRRPIVQHVKIGKAVVVPLMRARAEELRRQQEKEHG